jgi:hypothetical protein
MSSRFYTSNVSSGKSEIKRELITGRIYLITGRILTTVGDLFKNTGSKSGCKQREGFPFKCFCDEAKKNLSEFGWLK